MKEKSINQSDFVVRNSIVVIVITAIVFLCMLASIFEYNTDLGSWGYVIIAALVPLIAYFIRKRIATVIIRINKNGIYEHGKLITDWSHFQSAKVDHLPIALFDPRDRVVLKVFFYSPDGQKLFEKQLRLHNTFNKSEEQIFAAIERFRKPAAA